MAIEKVKINLVLSDLAKQKILEKAESSGLRQPIPDLMWSKWSDEREYKWKIGFHERDEIFEGWMFNVSGVEFYTCQDWLFERLEGKTLDIVDGRLVVQ